MPRPVLVFAHGAGADSSSPWMSRYAERLSKFAHVARFDYPYMQRGKRAPDPLPRLVEAHREALSKARKGRRGQVFLIGKSMGGRVGCHLALEEKADGVICLGYPLKGMGKAGKVRDRVLLDSTVPILFVQGTRDALCPLDLLATVRRKMKAKNELMVIDGGNHSLELTRTRLKELECSPEGVEQQIADRIRQFVTRTK